MRPLLSGISLVAALDWLLKATVQKSAELDVFQILPGGRFAVWHVQNHEMMLGLWGDYSLQFRQVLALGAALLSLALLQALSEAIERARPQSRRMAEGFCILAFGGILGNLGERALHWYVTDFFSISIGGIWFPPGNLADACLFASFFLLPPLLVREAREGRAFSFQVPATSS